MAFSCLFPSPLLQKAQSSIHATMATKRKHHASDPTSHQTTERLAKAPKLRQTDPQTPFPQAEIPSSKEGDPTITLNDVRTLPNDDSPSAQESSRQESPLRSLSKNVHPEKVNSLTPGRSHSAYVKGSEESPMQFVDRMIESPKHADSVRLTTSRLTLYPEIDEDHISQLQTDVTDKIALHMATTDDGYDTDDVKSGRYDPHLAVLPLKTRRNLLHHEILDIGAHYGVKRGKWVASVGTESFLDTFMLLASECDQGDLGIAIEGIWNRKEPRSILCVWSSNLNDLDTNTKIARRLHLIHANTTYYYKPEVFSILDLDGQNRWGVKVTTLKSRNLLKRV